MVCPDHAETLLLLADTPASINWLLKLQVWELACACAHVVAIHWSEGTAGALTSAAVLQKQLLPEYQGNCNSEAF